MKLLRFPNLSHLRLYHLLRPREVEFTYLGLPIEPLSRVMVGMAPYTSSIPAKGKRLGKVYGVIVLVCEMVVVREVSLRPLYLANFESHQSGFSEGRSHLTWTERCHASPLVRRRFILSSRYVLSVFLKVRQVEFWRKVWVNGANVLLS
jgi:hypothetical protein